MSIEHWTRRFGIGRLMGVAVFVVIGLVVLPAMAHGQGAREKLLSAMSAAGGQSFEGRATTRTFGLGLVSDTVSGIHFTGFEMSYPDMWDTNDSGSRSCAVPSCILVAPVELPAGALITAIELNACDQSAVSDATVALTQTPVNEGTPIILATAKTTGVSFGCGFLSTVLPSPHTVDNVNNTYSLTYTGADDNATRVQAVRVFYHLQISPAPAVASFNDVPTTHPFFQFIEALVAAGITSGCGGGGYCPDSPVTRGQMAVFLSRALGLHFAP